MKRLRVLLLITNLGKGGAQRVFYDHAVALAQHHDVDEAVYAFSEAERVYNSGLRLHQLDQAKSWFHFGPLGRLIGRSLLLRRLVNKNKYDVVISHMDGANWTNILSASRARKILVVHGTVLHDRNVGRLVQWMRTKFIFPVLYNFADRTVAVSVGIQSELRKTGRVTNVTTIQNFFDVQGIDRASRGMIAPCMEPAFDHPFVMMVSARLEKQKNLSSLIDILGSLKISGFNSRLVILGDGSLRNTLIQKARTLQLKVYDIWSVGAQTTGVEYDVWFLGHVENPFCYLARGSLFVFPSAWEGFPLALCEAMICGLPVISSDCPTGPREILSPGSDELVIPSDNFLVAKNGILAPTPVDKMSQHAWFEAIVHLASDEQLRISLAARGRDYVAGMDRQNGLASWLNLLTEVCGERRQS